MVKIIKENGKIWHVEEMEMYGVIHTTRILIGTYEEPVEYKEPPKKVSKRNSKKNEITD